MLVCTELPGVSFQPLVTNAALLLSVFLFLWLFLWSIHLARCQYLLAIRSTTRMTMFGFMSSFSQSLTHSLLCLLTPVLVRSLTHSLTHPLTHVSSPKTRYIQPPESICSEQNQGALLFCSMKVTCTNLRYSSCSMKGHVLHSSASAAVCMYTLLNESCRVYSKLTVSCRMSSRSLQTSQTPS